MFLIPWHTRWNCDEVGVAIDQRVIRLCTTRKSIIQQQSAARDNHVTVMICANAEGELAPSAWIVQGSDPASPFFSGIPPTDAVSVQENGYMTDNIFKSWTNHFVNYIKDVKQETGFTLLITDGHQSRLNPTVLWSLLMNQVLLLCLPAHTTHLLQPNDAGVNKAFKRNLDVKLEEFASANITVTKEMICPMAYEALHSDNIPAAAVNSFRHVGISPFDSSRACVLLQPLEPTRTTEQVLNCIHLVQEHCSTIEILRTRTSRGEIPYRPRRQSATAEAELLNSVDNIALREVEGDIRAMKAMNVAPLREYCTKTLKIPTNSLEKVYRGKQTWITKPEMIKIAEASLNVRRNTIFNSRKADLQRHYHELPVRTVVPEFVLQMPQNSQQEDSEDQEVNEEQHMSEEQDLSDSDYE